MFTQYIYIYYVSSISKLIYNGRLILTKSTNNNSLMLEALGIPHSSINHITFKDPPSYLKFTGVQL